MVIEITLLNRDKVNHLPVKKRTRLDTVGVLTKKKINADK